MEKVKAEQTVTSSPRRLLIGIAGWVRILHFTSSKSVYLKTEKVFTGKTTCTCELVRFCVNHFDACTISCTPFKEAGN